MKPEHQLFVAIRNELVVAHAHIEIGTMMGSPAIIQNGKVFAFLSKKFQMVFKLGKEFEPRSRDFLIRPFNPFRKKGPLPGWFEVPFSERQLWKSLTMEAMELNS